MDKVFRSKASVLYCYVEYVYNSIHEGMYLLFFRENVVATNHIHYLLH